MHFCAIQCFAIHLYAVCIQCFYVLVVQKQYRSDLNWMKGVGWETAGSLDVQQAKKACDMASEVTSHPDYPAICTRFTWFRNIVSQIKIKKT